MQSSGWQTRCMMGATCANGEQIVVKDYNGKQGCALAVPSGPQPPNLSSQVTRKSQFSQKSYAGHPGFHFFIFCLSTALKSKVLFIYSKNRRLYRYVLNSHLISTGLLKQFSQNSELEKGRIVNNELFIMSKAVIVKIQLLNAVQIKINNIRSVKLIFLAMNDFV